MTTSFPRAAGPTPLGIEMSFPSPGTVRMAVAGEVDLATAPMLGMRLLTVMDARHPAIVDVDLAEVSFLDCAGIGVLAAARNAAGRTGCQILISHPQPMVARVLEVVGLLALFAAPAAPAVLPAPRSTSSWRARSGIVRMARAMVGRVAA